VGQPEVATLGLHRHLLAGKKSCLVNMYSLYVHACISQSLARSVEGRVFSYVRYLRESAIGGQLEFVRRPTH
jgi:hypothetical protein